MSTAERRAIQIPAWSRCASMVFLGMATVISNQATHAIKEGTTNLTGWEWTLFATNVLVGGVVAWRAWVDKTSARAEAAMNGTLTK